MSYDYPSPVDKLLMYGVPPIEPIPNYLELGFTHDHVNALIQLATDRNLLLLEDFTAVEGYAPIHAWRTLQQLRAEEALIPLIQLFALEEDEVASTLGITEWLIDEMPEFYASFGVTAIPILKAHINDLKHTGEYEVGNAATALQMIGSNNPDLRLDCIEAIASRLEHFADNDAMLNAWLISSLLELKAVEVVDLIGQAFAADAVDVSITGDFDDAKVALGLMRPEDLPMPRPRFQPTIESFLPAAIAPASKHGFGGSKKDFRKAEKNKRKQSQKSQKINRKKKKR